MKWKEVLFFALLAVIAATITYAFIAVIFEIAGALHWR